MKKLCLLSMVTVVSTLLLSACGNPKSDSVSVSDVKTSTPTHLSIKETKDSSILKKESVQRKSDGLNQSAETGKVAQSTEIKSTPTPEKGEVNKTDPLTTHKPVEPEATTVGSKPMLDSEPGQAITIPNEVVGTWSGISTQADSVEFTIGSDGSFFSVSKYGSQTDYPRTEEAVGYITNLVEDSPGVYRIKAFSGNRAAFLPGITGLGGYGLAPDTGFTIRNGQFVPIVWNSNSWQDFGVAYSRGSLKDNEPAVQPTNIVPIPPAIVGTWSGKNVQADSVEFTITADGMIYTTSEYNRHYPDAVRVEYASARIAQLLEVVPGVYRVNAYSGHITALLPGITGIGGVGDFGRAIGFDVRDGHFIPIVFESDNSWHGFGDAVYDKGVLSTEEQVAREKSILYSPF